MRQNKYDYLYVLQSDYGFGHGWEDLCAQPQTLQGRQAIMRERQEYVENEGSCLRVIKRREVRV